MNAQTAVAEVTRKASPVEVFRQEVLPPDRAADLFRALPSHIKPAVFERNLINALMQNPDLMSFHPSLVYREVSKAAGLGLLLDPQLGEAYIVVAYNGKTKKTEPQLRIGYKGMCKLARQTGDVVSIYAHEVHANDQIHCQLGTDKRLDHRPELFTDRGPVVGYYSVIKYQDGGFDFEPMSVKQTQAIRDRSDAWKAYKDGKIRSTPWSTDEDEMAKKTTIRRLMKRQAQSPELAEALRIEDEAEFPSMREAPVRAAAPPPPPPPPPPVIEHKPAPPEPRDPAVKEMIEVSPQRPLRAPPPPAPEVDIVADEDVLADIEAKLGAATSDIVLDETWELLSEDVNALPMHLREQAKAIYQVNIHRLAEA